MSIIYMLLLAAGVYALFQIEARLEDIRATFLYSGPEDV